MSKQMDRLRNTYAKKPMNQTNRNNRTVTFMVAQMFQTDQRKVSRNQDENEIGLRKHIPLLERLAAEFDNSFDEFSLKIIPLSISQIIYRISKFMWISLISSYSLCIKPELSIDQLIVNKTNVSNSSLNLCK